MSIAQNKQELLLDQYPMKQFEDKTIMLRTWRDEYGRTKNEIFVEMRSLADYADDWKKEGAWEK